MTHNKAYILGLLIGGGKLDSDTFMIELPYKKWGMAPKKMNTIAVDILSRISSLFKEEYNIDITYEIGNNKWLIKPFNNMKGYKDIKRDLLLFKLPTSGFLLNESNISACKQKMQGIIAEKFLTGIFDTRASISLSHRRFSNEAPVVSIEIPGSTKNFSIVVELCSWLNDLGSITDQVLYNHPNQHASSNPYYSGWKKGFKIRFLVRSFIAKHSFALEAKAINIKEIEKKQKKKDQTKCPYRKIKTPSPVTIHNDLNHPSLPNNLRNRLFFHYFHYCAVYGCAYAPYEEVTKLINKKHKLISFFPRLMKGNKEEINYSYQSIIYTYFSKNQESKSYITLNALINNHNYYYYYYYYYYGLLEGLAYLFSKKLNGKRHVGSMQKIINANKDKIITIRSIATSSFEPIAIENPNNERAFICSSIDSEKNQELLSKHIKVDGYNVILKNY